MYFSKKLMQKYTLTFYITKNEDNKLKTDYLFQVNTVHLIHLLAQKTCLAFMQQ